MAQSNNCRMIEFIFKYVIFSKINKSFPKPIDRIYLKYAAVSV